MSTRYDAGAMRRVSEVRGSMPFELIVSMLLLACVVGSATGAFGATLLVNVSIADLALFFDRGLHDCGAGHLGGCCFGLG